MAQSMKITEKYEFLTDIITSYDGTEQRLKLRQYPRHYLTYDYSAMDLYQAQYLRGIARMKQTDAWYMPMWHYPCYLKQDFVKDGVALSVDKDYLYGFDEVEYLVIHKIDDVIDDGKKNIVRAIRRYSTDEIEVKTKIPEDLLVQNTFIYPLRKCIFPSTAPFEYGYSNGTEIAIQMEDLCLQSKIHLPNSIRYEYEKIDFQYNRWNLPKTFNNLEVFFVEPKWEETDDVKLQIDKRAMRIDNETGLFMYDMINDSSYDIHYYTMYFETRPKINNLIKFFKRMYGRYKTFYMPTWANDFEITRDMEVGQEAIYTDFKKLYKFYISNTRHKYIVIFTKDWKSYIYPVMSYTYETILRDNEKIVYGKLMLQEPIHTKLKVEDILMCSYFNLVRFDDDALTIDYESNVCARVAISVKEVDV